LKELPELMTDDNVGKVFKVVNVKVIDVEPRSKDGEYTVTLKAGRVTGVECLLEIVARELRRSEESHRRECTRRHSVILLMMPE
jgi:hypothetical protein